MSSFVMLCLPLRTYSSARLGLLCSALLTGLAACGGSDEVGDNTDGSGAPADAGFDGSTSDDSGGADSETDTGPETDASTDIGDNDGTVAPDTAPSSITITGVLPACGPTIGGTSVIVQGTGFGSGAEVQFGDTLAPGALGTPGSVAVDTPPAAATGRVDVTVTQDADQNTLVDGFFYHRSVQWRTRIETPEEFSDLMALGDIDGDGLADLVRSTSAGIEVRTLADQQGAFTSTTTSTECTTPSALAITDFTGDGVGDVVVGCGANLQVLIGADGGGLTAGPLSETSPTGGNYHLEMATADLNGNGTTDLVMRSQNLDTVQVFLNDGTGTFTLVGQPLEVGDDLTGVKVGDFDNDGDADLLTAHFGPGVIRVRLGNGDGTFGQPIESPIPGVQTLSLLDANEDGRLDLGVGSNDGAVGASVYLGAGDGSFVPLKVVQRGGLVSAALFDMDADGLADVIVGDGTEFRVYLDALADYPACTVVAPIPDALFALIPGDINGDGVTDVVGFNPNQRALLTLVSEASAID